MRGGAGRGPALAARCVEVGLQLERRVVLAPTEPNDPDVLLRRDVGSAHAPRVGHAQLRRAHSNTRSIRLTRVSSGAASCRRGGRRANQKRGAVQTSGAPAPAPASGSQQLASGGSAACARRQRGCRRAAWVRAGARAHTIPCPRGTKPRRPAEPRSAHQSSTAPMRVSVISPVQCFPPPFCSKVDKPRSQRAGKWQASAAGVRTRQSGQEPCFAKRANACCTALGGASWSITVSCACATAVHTTSKPKRRPSHPAFWRWRWQPMVRVCARCVTGQVPPLMACFPWFAAHRGHFELDLFLKTISRCRS